MIMSPSTFSAESQWLSQLAAMREAIAGLKLQQQDDYGKGYGYDLQIGTDEDSESSGIDDIWDVLSDSGGALESADSTDGAGKSVVDWPAPLNSHRWWMKNKCLELARTSTGFSGDELQDQILVLLASNLEGMPLLLCWAERAKVCC